MKTLYIFQFKQQVLGTPQEPCTYRHHSFIAETHAEAFAKWCAMPAIQDIPMTRLGILWVEVDPAQ